MSPEQKAKKELFEIYEKVAKARQTAFMGTYKDIHQRKKDELAKEGWIRKGVRYIGNLIVALIFLGIVFLFFKP